MCTCGGKGRPEGDGVSRQAQLPLRFGEEVNRKRDAWVGRGKKGVAGGTVFGEDC